MAGQPQVGLRSRGGDTRLVDEASTAVADADAEADASARRPRAVRRVRADLLLAGGMFAIALGPRAMTAGAYSGPDESIWLMRSHLFIHAVQNGDWARASSSWGRTATMPGITTMWVGSASRGVWSLGARAGMWSDADVDAGFIASQSGLTVSQLMMALVTAALVAVVAVLVARWAGRAAGVVAGALLATEPFLVTHGATLHTDEMVALFGVAGMIALAIVLGVPRRASWTDRSWLALSAGVLCMLAILTKLSGLTFLPSAGLLAAWALVQRCRAQPEVPIRARVAPVVRSAGLWAVGAAATLLVYPALLVAPRVEVGRLVDSMRLADAGHPQFFLGEVTIYPGRLYYLVAVPLRLTPWFSIALLVAAVGLWFFREVRGHAATLVVLGLPTFVVISLSSKQMDRYGVPLAAVGAVVVGVAVGPAVAWLRGRGVPALRRPMVLGLAGVLVLAGHAVAIAPWGSTYYNPLLGGGDRATRTIMVGRGEGTRQAGAFIAEHAAGRCDEITIRTRPAVGAYPCGNAVLTKKDADYVVLAAATRQRSQPATLTALAAERPLLAVISVRGVDHIELYGPIGDAVDETAHIALG